MALANIAGGSRPQMVTLDRLEAQVALLPLLSRRVEIDRLVLVLPTSCWRPTPKAARTGGSARRCRARPCPARRRRRVNPPRRSREVQDLRIEDGTVTYRDGRTGTARRSN